MKSFAARRDRFAGALLLAIGAGAILEARSYDVGSLREMGPGFMPFALGVVLLLCGGIVAAGGRGASDDPDAFEPEGADWRGWLCILGGLLWFIATAERFGLFPATFGCVLIAARGDRSTGWRTAVLLALALSVFGVLLFSVGLRVQLPAWRW